MTRIIDRRSRGYRYSSNSFVSNILGGRQSSLHIDLREHFASLAREVVEFADGRTENLCSAEKERLVRANAPEQTFLKDRVSAYTAEIAAHDRLLASMDEVESADRRGGQVWYWSVMIIAWVFGFFAAYSVFDAFLPTDLSGRHALLIAMSLTIMPISFLIEIAIERIANSKLMTGLLVASALIGLIAISYKEVVRADVYERDRQEEAVKANRDAGIRVNIQPPQENKEHAEDTFPVEPTFYDSTAQNLKVTLLAFSWTMALAAGFASYFASRGRRLAAPAKERSNLEQRRRELMIERTKAQARLVELENEPAETVAAIKRGRELYLWPEMMRRINKVSNGRALGIFVVMASLGAGIPAADAQQALRPADVVVGLDLTKSSKSSARNSHDPQSPYRHNVRALQRLVTRLSPGSSLTVLAITDRTASAPWVLFSAQLPTSRGRWKYADQVQASKRRITAALQELLWVEPVMGDTSDVLGFFVIAPDYLGRRDPRRRKVAVAFSDMGESASVNLERPSRIDVERELTKIEALGLVPDLGGVEIYVFGVHAPGKDAGYLPTLKTLWDRYFEKAGAELKVFSSDRDVRRVDFGGAKEGGAR